MKQAIRAALLFGAVVAVLHTARAQNTPDKVTVRNKDGTTKTYDGTFTLSPAGFQIIGTDKKTVVFTVPNPDDVVKVSIGDLPGIDRSKIQSANTKEFPTNEKTPRDYDGARLIYEDLKKGKIGDSSRRYVEFKIAWLNHKMVDEVDYDKGWEAKATEQAKLWRGFLINGETKFGWEQWPAVRACTRLQIELNKFDDAANTWGYVVKNTNAPAEVRLEAGMQEIDMNIRGKQYAPATVAAAELLKTAAGVKKDRLVIYEIAAKACAEAKPLEGVDKIKAEMNKTKDAAVHATGFSMLGELYLAGGKPRDAMWMFLWVETVVNQDKDEAFKALARLAGLFEAQKDDEQGKKYRDKLKRFRATF